MDERAGKSALTLTRVTSRRVKRGLGKAGFDCYVVELTDPLHEHHPLPSPHLSVPYI